MLYFRGQRIWQAIILDLLPKGLRYAKKALRSGCSAGGLASFLHCDNFTSFLPTNASVKCLSDGGFFLDIRDISLNHTMRSFYEDLVTLQAQFGLTDPFMSRCCSKSFTRTQGLLVLVCVSIVAAWLVSGHWVLNNLLGISICIAFVSHVRLPNIKICAMLLVCLFLYDIFWVFFSERFFGANVMVSVATQQASNPVHTVANSLNLPGLELITKKLELPVKIVFPRNLFVGGVSEGNAVDFIMLGLGDMAIPAMLMALVLSFDHQKTRETVDSLDLHFSKEPKYIWYALPGYAIGLVTAIAAGVLTRSPQPALLYLVPSTLGPIIVVSWIRKELTELWEGPMQNSNDKARSIEV